MSTRTGSTYDWRSELEGWVSRRRWLRGIDSALLFSFFERAFSHAEDPSELWFGVHGTGASLVGGQLYVATLHGKSGARGIWLLTTLTASDDPDLELVTVKAIRAPGETLNWLFFDPHRALERVLDDDSIWRSYAEATGRIVEYGQGRGRDDLQRRRGKVRLSSFWTERTDIESDPKTAIRHSVRWDQYFTTEEYIVAFQKIAHEVSEIEYRILGALYNSPSRTSFASKIAADANVSGGWRAINSHFGRLSRRISETLGCREPYRLPDGQSRWWPALSIGHRTYYGYRWELLTEVASALEELGWVGEDKSQTVDRSPEVRGPYDITLLEGAPIVRRTILYERNPRARELCLQVYGTACSVCGLDFGRVYGVEVEGYIHVHHTRPLATIGAEYEIDPVEDLRPVCPNCHAVIHQGGKLRSIDEVRAMLTNAKTDP